MTYEEWLSAQSFQFQRAVTSNDWIDKALKRLHRDMRKEIDNLKEQLPMTPDDMTSKDPGPREFSEKEMIEMWPQAAGELRGYATHLMRRGIGITSAQMFMAVQMADAFLAMLKDRQKPTVGG